MACTHRQLDDWRRHSCEVTGSVPGTLELSAAVEQFSVATMSTVNLLAVHSAFCPGNRPTYSYGGKIQASPL